MQAARQLLTLDTKDPKRLFEGPALLRRMVRFGLLGEDERELDFVLQLTTEKMLERRLQTKVCCAACVVCRRVRLGFLFERRIDVWGFKDEAIKHTVPFGLLSVGSIIGGSCFRKFCPHRC